MAFHYPKPREHVEPEALSISEFSLARREGFVSDGEAAVSVAISLKRIADALEKLSSTTPQPRSERE